MARLMPTIILLGLLTAGCSDCMSPVDYGHAWRQAVIDYRSIQKDPGTLASYSGAGNGDDSTALSNAAHTISEQIRDIGKTVHEWKAPPLYQVLQDDTYIFYRGQADNYLGYANAIAEGNPDKIQEAADSINAFADEQRSKINKDIADLGKDGMSFEDAWKDVFNPMPMPTEPAPTPAAPPNQKAHKKSHHKS